MLQYIFIAFHTVRVCSFSQTSNIGDNHKVELRLLLRLKALKFSVQLLQVKTDYGCPRSGACTIQDYTKFFKYFVLCGADLFCIDRMKENLMTVHKRSPHF